MSDSSPSGFSLRKIYPGRPSATHSISPPRSPTFVLRRAFPVETDCAKASYQRISTATARPGVLSTDPVCLLFLIITRNYSHTSEDLYRNCWARRVVEPFCFIHFARGYSKTSWAGWEDLKARLQPSEGSRMGGHPVQERSGTDKRFRFSSTWLICSLQASLRRLCKEHLAVGQPFSRQSPAALKTVTKLVRSELKRHQFFLMVLAISRHWHSMTS